MRVASESERRDVPRWTLWLVAVVCFVPLTFMWLLGLLYVLLWVGMSPERLAHEPSATISDFASPVGWWVIGGFIGLVGLVRVLTLSRREPPKSHRVFTIGMVAVGVITLLSFHWPLVGAESSDFLYLVSVGGLTYTVLPFAGAVWLLAKSWRFLFAGSVRPDVESRRSRLRREHRDDWRLDA